MSRWGNNSTHNPPDIVTHLDGRDALGRAMCYMTHNLAAYIVLVEHRRMRRSD